MMLWVSFLLLLCSGVLLVFFFSEAVVVEWELLDIFGHVFSVVLVFDFFSYLFSFVVLLISSMIFFFSKYYMDEDKTQTMFSVLLLGFVLSMLCLILSPNMVMLLLGWDGLGVTSYLLVVYYMGHSSSVAGMTTFLVNRLGDVFFLFSIVLLSIHGNWDFYSFKSSYFLLALCLMIAFSTKSAQIPFSSWLPVAMAAPTPVSSLVHSSTLVTAGVFLMIRFSESVSVFSFFLFYFSAMTLLMAGAMANYEWDMKKLIALSTLSQLGFMVSSFSMGLVLLGFFHLLSHALFKASLFMCSGVLIHSADNSQDFRNSSGFMGVKPLIASAVMVCLLCLCGFPLTSGFFSKDLIIDGGGSSLFIFFFFLSAVALTVSYSFRFCWYLFINYFFLRVKLFLAYEVVFYLLFPIWVLVVFSLLGGFFMFEYFFSMGLFVLLSFGWKLFYFFFLFLFFFFSFFFINSLSAMHHKAYFLSSMWYLSDIVGWRLGRLSLSLGKVVVKVSDHGFSEFFGPQGLYYVLGGGSRMLLRANNFNFFVFLFFFFVLLWAYL